MRFKISTLSLSIATLLCVSENPSHAVAACANKIGGTWNYGSVPNACNVSPTQTQSFVKGQYSTVLFSDAAGSAGRAAYVSAMYPVLREMGVYYIKRRNPKVSNAELNGFLNGFFALGAQESYWSHYRKGSDQIIRFMRGDVLHGYGLMQLDDRSHSVAIKAGKGTDLAENMVYGLDIFYSNWVKAAKASCVSSPRDYKARARAAWAAYNGGGGSICRWTNPNSAWARNDKGYLANYNNRTWLNYTKSTTAASSLDVRCLAEGVRPCAAPRK